MTQAKKYGGDAKMAMNGKRLSTAEAMELAALNVHVNLETPKKHF